MNMTPDTSSASLEEQIFAFLENTYRQIPSAKDVGEQYISAETHELSANLALFVTQVAERKEKPKEKTPTQIEDEKRGVVRLKDGTPIPKIETEKGEETSNWLKEFNLFLEEICPRYDTLVLMTILCKTVGHLSYMLAREDKELAALQSSLRFVTNQFFNTMEGVEDAMERVRKRKVKEENGNEEEED